MDVNSINPSINSIDTQVIADFVKGSRGSKGQLSPVRRFFCLFVTFDLIFTTLLWLICIVLAGEQIIKSIEDEIVHYSVALSLFDIVMIACMRFVILLLFYALLHLNHWWVVALTTSGCSAFLIAKVFVYSWENSKNTTLIVLLILVSFTISWSEAWFLDFRVFPKEQKAKLIEEKFLRGDERSPLLQSYDGIAYTGSVDDRTFYSPLQSPTESDEEIDIQAEFLSSRELTEQELEYKKYGREVLERAWKVFHSGGWKCDKTSEEGDVVYTMNHPKIGKIFKLTGTVNAKPEKLLQELFFKHDDIPKWNPTVIFCKVLQKIDSHTDISYQVTAEAAGGLITSRDFVSLRHWDVRGNVYVVAGISISHDSMPHQPNYIRGENGPSILIMKPHPENRKQCQLHMLLNTDLKGWLPQYLIDQALSSVMFDYIKYIRKHMEKLKEDEYTI